ncbi:MAG: adenylate kinase [Clostridia bacterium]|nr:adenylate kinase [Clostridia bacterium]
MKLIFLGPPGAGKGTQAAVIAEHFNIPTISTGAMIREEINAETPLGLAAKQLINEGKLISDDVIMKMLEERLKYKDCQNGFILDGVPRTIPQAEMIDAITKIDKVIEISVADEVIVERLSGRRECADCKLTYNIKSNPPKIEGKCDKCGKELSIRDDDRPETIKNRLAVYHKQTEPLKDFYKDKGILSVFDGTNDIDKISADIIKALEVIA